MLKFLKELPFFKRAQPNNIPLPKFTVADDNLIQSWKDFKEELDFYLIATDQSEEGGKKKVALLLCAMGRDYIKVFNNLEFEEDAHKNDFDRVVAKFTDYFEPKKLTKLFVTKFQSRHQQEGESMAEYVNALKELAKNCEFGAIEENMLVVQISNGVLDEELRRKLWDDDLTLAETVRKCHVFEQRKLNSGLYTQPSVSMLQKKQYQRGPQQHN